ncbi:hypothetical protein TNCV_2134231 [Trichonephila clavipes]|nr:hypothetical protein TNCV_2134231 [Trichonephila clavipes]
MSACGREFHISCMRSKSSSFEAAGSGSRARRVPTKSHTCSIADVDELKMPRLVHQVAVDQRAANCLEEAVWSFTAMRSRCRSSRNNITFPHPLPVFRVVRGLPVH